jgi:pyruvate formate lyase activating enzyme
MDKIIFARNLMTSGMIFDIKRYAINDGPGIRTSVFLKGCPLKCWWCHNPEGQSRNSQLIYRLNRCKASQACVKACPLGAISWKDGPVTDWQACDQCGKCAQVCYAGAREMIGREINVEALIAELERDIPFYDQSGGGVTFTGGEPMLQLKFLQASLLACKKQKIHTTVDTCGYTAWENFISILPLVDVFLFDIKLIDQARHKKYTSVSNKKILDNLRKLSREMAQVIVRIPLIPGVNDDNENLMLCVNYLRSLPNLVGLEIMPYHETGVAKYQALGMPYKMDNTTPPTRERINQIEELFSSNGLRVIRHLAGRNA